MQQHKKYPKILLLAVVLLGSLPLLAVLQYNWLSQLSQADYVRMQSNIERVAQRFSQDVDQELIGAHVAFVGSRAPARAVLADELVELFNRWEALSPYAAIVNSIYLVEKSDSGAPALYRFDKATGHLTQANWPAAVVNWITQQPLYQAHRLPQAESQTNEWISPIPFSGTTGLIQPGNLPPIGWPTGMMASETFNQLLLGFDTSYIFDQMIPALAAKYFPETADTAYDLLITKHRAPNAILYRSDATLTTSSFEVEDFSMNIGMPDQPQIMHTFSQLLGAQSPITPETMMAFFRKGFQYSRLTAGGPPAGMGGGSAGFMPVRTWQLYIKHKAGPLDQIVAQTRNRNLWISFAVLLILGLSIAIIIIYTRRMQMLADQQMAFVAGVSHELRTPLAVVHAAGENLQDGLITDMAETQDYGKLIVDESRSLLNTIEQVLAYAGISFGLGPPPDTEVYVNTLIHQILDENREALRSFELQLQLDEDLPPVRGDREALHTVLQNLVQNALKYTNGKKWIAIHSQPADTHEKAVEVVIQDRGIGIDLAEQANIFEPFYRTADVRKTQIRGNGLGLSIARQILHVHGGDISVTSTPNNGSAFCVTLLHRPPKVSPTA